MNTPSGEQHLRIQSIDMLTETKMYAGRAKSCWCKLPSQRMAQYMARANWQTRQASRQQDAWVTCVAL